MLKTAEWAPIQTPACIIIPIINDRDIVTARQKAREMSGELGFSSSQLAIIATAISELARNIVSYAGEGKISLQQIRETEKKGIAVTAEDNGPGIENIDLAMQDGYSTSNSLGLGLPGVRRLMDTFAIHSAKGKGTKIVVVKWSL